MKIRIYSLLLISTLLASCLKDSDVINQIDDESVNKEKSTVLPVPTPLLWVGNNKWAGTYGVVELTFYGPNPEQIVPNSLPVFSLTDAKTPCISYNTLSFAYDGITSGAWSLNCAYVSWTTKVIVIPTITKTIHPGLIIYAIGQRIKTITTTGTTHQFTLNFRICKVDNKYYLADLTTEPLLID